MADPGAARPDRIVVTENQVAMLARSFESTWLRPPTAAELESLVDEYVTEEALYREAVALGLDRDDLVVRRRMRQKMEFLNDGLALGEPGEEALRAFLAEHPERFGVPPRLGFVQVFLDPERGAVEQRAGGLVARLRAGETPDALGDATLLPRRMDDATPAQVADRFGPEFAEALGRAPEGEWTGPLASGFGAHLVRVDARRPGRIPGLEEVREAVEREWLAEQRAQARERFHRTLRSRYEVEVHMPRPGAASAAPELAAGP